MEKPRLNSIETSANYEGNDSLLLFQRVRNPLIRKQIIDLLFESECSRAGELIEVAEKNGPTEFKKGPDGEVLFKTVPYSPLSREELEADLDEALQREEGVTQISFNDDPNVQSTSFEIQMKAIAPWGGKPYDEKQMSIIEAHEKGHNLRPYYRGEFLEGHFKGAFAFDAAVFLKSDIEMYRKVLGEDEKNESDEKVTGILAEYLFSPMEVAERMSQLKNYFGMSGDETFTPEHLLYAREHYVVDTGMDNGMGAFFRAIKPETEEEFLRLINCSGI
jgi:hypothetical protein